MASKRVTTELTGFLLSHFIQLFLGNVTPLRFIDSMTHHQLCQNSTTIKTNERRTFHSSRNERPFRTGSDPETVRIFLRTPMNPFFHPRESPFSEVAPRAAT